MNLLQRKITRSLLIRGLALLGGALIARGWTDAQTWSMLATNEEILAGAVAIIGMVWDLIVSNKRDIAVVERAIESPGSMTVEEVERDVPKAGFRLPSANR